jgi:hypothetical protein
MANFEDTISMSAIRVVVGRLGLRSMFGNPALAEAVLYVCILASLTGSERPLAVL